MDSVDVGKIVTIEGNDFVVLDTVIKENKKYVFLKGVDENEELLDSQIIARVVIDDMGDFALEDIDDRFLLETLRNEFANRLREEYMKRYSFFCAIIN